ncbi:MAG TPA: AAA family ATPase [bacterium]|nr:AAA family ATPase [bacterium]
MKTALIGTHGVGKTTLCYEVAAHLKRLDCNVELVTEVARDCPLPINRETTLDAQQWILHTQCAREIAAQRTSGVAGPSRPTQNSIVVCDRSVLDNYAYLVCALGRQSDLDPWLRNWCRTYTRLFKVPVWKPPAFDGTRDTGLEFQREVDEAIEALIADWKIDVVMLDPAAPQNWTERVLLELRTST